MSILLRYSGANDEFLWIPVIAMAGIFGVANLAIQALKGEIRYSSNGLKSFGSGTFVGALIGAGMLAGLRVSVLDIVIKTICWIYVGSGVLSAVGGIIRGVFWSKWSHLANTGKILAGTFYLDGHRNFFQQVWQGISRFSWELLQSAFGHAYSQIQNTIGNITLVDYFGGATYAVNEKSGYRDGISIGNNINIKIANEIQGDFENRVITDPLFIHEYGHIFDSQIFGLSYLFVIGIPSLLSASKSSQISGEPYGVSTHDMHWTEIRANRHASKYIKKYYGVDWNRPYKDYAIETFYPTKKR